MANRVHEVLKALGRWAAERGIVERSPFEHLRPPAKELSRERVLTVPEIKALLAARDEEAYPVKQLVTMLLLTGARRAEVAQMKWAEVDFEAKVWTLPRERSKNGHELVLPLSEALIDMLRVLPHLQLHWTSSGRTGESRQCEAHIALTTKPQPLGGRRWYFVCPLTGANVTKLHKPVGASTFGSRSAYNLGYRSQRQSPRDRSISRAFTLREKIGDKGAIGDYIPKPKGMHWRTFGRALERVQRGGGNRRGTRREVAERLALMAQNGLAPLRAFGERVKAHPPW